MDLLKNLDKSIRDIYDHIGYDTSNHGLLEIEDNSESYWSYNKEESSIGMAPTRKELKNEEGRFCYEGVEQDGIYRGEKYVGVIMTNEGYPGIGSTLAIFLIRKEALNYYK